MVNSVLRLSIHMIETLHACTHMLDSACAITNQNTKHNRLQYYDYSTVDIHTVLQLQPTVVILTILYHTIPKKHNISF